MRRDEANWVVVTELTIFMIMRRWSFGSNRKIIVYFFPFTKIWKSSYSLCFNVFKLII